MRNVSLAVASGEAELVADELWSLGASAIEERDVGDGRVGLVTSFADDHATDTAVAVLAARFAVEVHEVDEGVADTWRAFAVPVRVGERVVVEPAWLPSTAGPDDVVVRIDPGRAFGSGAHATTRLVLEALVRRLRPGDAVLDVGCGSGVLAVTAARLGAGEVHAVDVDPAAVVATMANASRNAVTVHLVEAPTGERRYDLVLANLLAPVVVDLAPALVASVAPGGCLVVGGLLDARFEHVVAALAPLAVDARSALDGWVCLELVLPR